MSLSSLWSTASQKSGGMLQAPGERNIGSGGFPGPGESLGSSAKGAIHQKSLE